MPCIYHGINDFASSQAKPGGCPAMCPPGGRAAVRHSEVDILPQCGIFRALQEGNVVRLVKRYGGGSRKLYDTEESRYISLDEVAGWVRDGQEVRVVDSASGEDVTRQVLAQIILEGEKQGKSLLSADLFHDVIRRGEAALHARVEQLQEGVDRLVKASVDHLPPVRDARDEMEALRQGIAELEQALRDLEESPRRPRAPRGGKGTRSRSRRG
jgi:polyhydroxyalkanoate synthesis repressor PhaR